jgi:hypothetical protein
VDPCLHNLQGKTEVVTDALSTLQRFYREKLADRTRHEAVARLVGQYDINNTYQYIINREDTQLSWIRAAIELAGASVAEAEAENPRIAAPGTDVRGLVGEDARLAGAFVERWRPRANLMTNARYRGMMRVILGEVQEQQRAFEQALAGRLDLLGRRTRAAGERVGTVMATRWVE